MSEVNKIDNKFNSVFFISHNPGLTDLANSLIDETIDNIPTSGVVGIQFDCDTWAEVEKGKGKKMFFEVPKNNRKKIEQNEKQEVL